MLAGPDLARFLIMQPQEIAMPSVKLLAEPAPLSVDLDKSALVVIDMQRDFLEPGGFGAALGNDVAQLGSAIEPIALLLATFRAYRLPIIHTREAHLPDLSDCPPSKRMRGRGSLRIG